MYIVCLNVYRASTSATGACPTAVLLKFTTNEDHQAAFWGRKGLATTKLGMDKDLMLEQQARKSELWPLFKEAKVTSKRAFWRVVDLFINGIRICPPSSM